MSLHCHNSGELIDKSRAKESPRRKKEGRKEIPRVTSLDKKRPRGAFKASIHTQKNFRVISAEAAAPQTIRRHEEGARSHIISFAPFHGHPRQLRGGDERNRLNLELVETRLEIRNGPETRGKVDVRSSRVFFSSTK